MTRVLLAAALAALCAPLRAEFTQLNLGLDYTVRGVSVGNNDMAGSTKDRLGYYSQSARLYMTAWLNEDVEAAFRLRSVNLWGLESAAAPATIYPKADGTPWIEEAYIHLPHMAAKRLDVTIGRQPIVLGDGMIVASPAGYNAVRGRLKGPWRTELDVFTAKVAESLNGNEDADLRGAVFRFSQEERLWSVAVVDEVTGSQAGYRLGFSTFTATRVFRRFYDVLLHGDLKDAYYKIEVALQQGEADIAGNTIDIRGMGQRLELGAQKDTDRWGRFGVRALYASGTGDDNGSPGTDEAFRPTYARRWDGLERSGYGQHFAATLSDVYDPASPFTPGTSGLPAGVSGIKTMGLGLFSTQKVFWTGSLDYFTYESRTKPTGLSDLGAELDASVTYRYTGFVTFKAGLALFFPGDVFGAGASRVTRTTLEAHVHF